MLTKNYYYCAMYKGKQILVSLKAGLDLKICKDSKILNPICLLQEFKLEEGTMAIVKLFIIIIFFKSRLGKYFENYSENSLFILTYLCLKYKGEIQY